jgi:hypothetical protein
LVAVPFLDQDVLAAALLVDLEASRPFPYTAIDRLLTDEGFAQLVAGFPPRHLFRWDEGKSGQHYVRPQDRWFLAHEPDRPTAPGSARTEDLPVVWQDLIAELQDDPGYRRLLDRATGGREAVPTFNWHVGVTGSEVCPHKDKDSKVATHIYYLNTAADWDPAWGGNMQVLDGRPAGVDFPDFDDFPTQTNVDTLGNRSFLFRNTEDAWHGVRPLTCPPGRERRLFNVVLMAPRPGQRPARRSWFRRRVRA